LEGGAYLRGDAYFKFWPIGGALIGRGAYLRGGVNLRILGILISETGYRLGKC